MRTERTQLQHEVDILNQRMTQETSNMKDELKGMFDDRKMSVRMEQKMMDSKVCAGSVRSWSQCWVGVDIIGSRRSRSSTTRSPSP